MGVGYFQFSSLFFIVLVAVAALILESYLFPQNFTWGYLLLFTSDREATLQYWRDHVKFNTAIIHPPIPVPEIQAKDFSFETFREATDNFRIPAVVRGMFNGTTAVEKWHTEDYLPSKLGHFTIPIVKNAVVGTLQDHRELVNFGDSFKQMWHAEYSKEYLFFPVRSRFTFNGSAEGKAEELQAAVDKLCREDLDYDRFWKTFGSKSHTTFQFAQFVIGKSTSQISKQSTGSDWHCAGGNNWFVQVHGRKYWEFIEPKYSPYLYPLKGGFFNMWTANKDIATLQKHIPRRFVVLEAGDMVYNPDWQWHKITNYGGLSIGVPIREINITLTIQNNKMFTSVVLANKFLTLFGLQLGGYPPPSLGTEADN